MSVSRHLDSDVLENDHSVFKEYLRRVWRDMVVFRRLNLANPGQAPIGHTAVVEDDLGFNGDLGKEIVNDAPLTPVNAGSP